MREESLRQFFTGILPADQLAIEAVASIKKVGPRETNIEIEDMPLELTVHRNEVLLLCDAALRDELPPEAIRAIAFMLIASDRFEWDWDDDVIPEVLSDWSCPEINYPLTATTFQMHRRWLSGSETVPARKQSTGGKQGGLISMVRKVRPNDH